MTGSLLAALLILSPGRASQTEITEVTVHLQAGRISGALKVLEPLARRFPGDPYVLGFLGRARLRAGDPSGAIAPLKKSLEQLSTDGEGYNNLGAALIQTERPKLAIEAFGRAVALMPRNRNALRNLAAAQTRAGAGQSAADTWARYVELVPADRPARCLYGSVLLALERPRLAAIQLRSGSQGNDDTVCLHDFADALGRIGEPTQALAMLDRLVGLDPDDAHAHYLRAYILVDAEGSPLSERLSRALQAIDRSVAARPKRAAAHHLRGYILARAERSDEALTAHQRALDLEPKNPAYAEAVAVGRVRAGEGKRVFQQLRRMNRRDPANLEVARALAQVLGEKKRHSKALQVLEATGNQTPVVIKDRAAILLASGAIDAARALLLGALKNHPGSADLLFDVAITERRSGLFPAALGHASTALSLCREAGGGCADETALVARLMLQTGRAKDAHKQVCSVESPSYDFSYLCARSLRVLGQLPGALKAAQAALDSAGDATDRSAAQRLRGKVLTDLGRGAEAIGIFRERGATAGDLGIALSRAGRAREAEKVLLRALRKHSDDVELHLALASAQRQLGKSGAALGTLEAARRRWSKNPGVINDLSLLYLAKGAKDRGIRLLLRGVADHPGHVQLVLNAAQHLSESGKHKQAQAVMRRAIVLEPHYGVLRTAYGDVLWSAGLAQKADRAFRDAGRCATPDQRALSRRGDIARRQRKLGKAIDLYRQALEADPALLEAYNGMAMSQHGLEQLDRAVATYRRGLAVDRNDPVLNNNLGSTLYLQRKFRSALTVFERAAAADPKEGRYWRNQIMVLKQMGRLDAAGKALALGKKAIPGDPGWANEALSLRKAIELGERLREGVAPGTDKAPPRR
jgi:tetratricopeptide (TPR) repeat protein